MASLQICLLNINIYRWLIHRHNTNSFHVTYELSLHMNLQITGT